MAILFSPLLLTLSLSGQPQDLPPLTLQTTQVCAVEGRVLDQQGGVLPGVTIVGEGAIASPVVSGPDGRYCLPLPAGAWVISATLSGFGSARFELPAQAQRPMTRDLTLGSTFAENVVVTATRTRRLSTAVPVRTEVVGRDAMDAAGARTLADAIEFTSGVRIENNCQNCNFSQIRLLGLEGPYTQILVDGHPVISSLAQVYGIEHIPTRMIERIEVIKGGGSALYGSGAVGGVINIIPREAPRSGGVVETRAERGGSLNAALDWASADRRSSINIYGQRDLVRPLDIDGDGFTEVSRRELTAAGTRFNRFFSDGRGKLSADVSFISEDRRGGDRLDLPPHEAEIAESIDSRRTSGTVTWYHQPAAGLDYRLTLAAADTLRDSYYGLGRDPNAYGTTTSRLWLGDAQVNHYRGRHTLSWGVQRTDDRTNDEQPGYGRSLRLRHRTTGIFAQHDWTMRAGWQVLSGVRADWHSALDAPILSPRFALLISPKDSLDVRVSIARGFRAPQIFDEDLHLTAIGGDVRLVELDPDLRPERATNLMAGVEWKPALGRGQALFETTLFHTRLTDLFHTLTTDTALFKTNLGGARVEGVEVNLGWGIGDDLVIQGGFVTQRARFDAPEPGFGSRDFFRTPRHYGSLTARWRSHSGWELFTGLKVTGRMVAPHYAGFISSDRLEQTPRFFTVDTSVSRALGPLTLTAAGRNLTNSYQRDFDRGPLRDAGYVYGPRLPRSFALSARVEF
jgi:outer membrane receptor for ferrienterochelin and colicins